MEERRVGGALFTINHSSALVRDSESLEHRVRPFPRSDEEKMAEQMTEQIAQQLRGLIPGVMIGGPGASGGLGSHVEEWLVPADEAAKLSVGKRVRVSLELVDE